MVRYFSYNKEFVFFTDSNNANNTRTKDVYLKRLYHWSAKYATFYELTTIIKELTITYTVCGVPLFNKIKDRLKCNRPVPSSKPEKKKMVKACDSGTEKLIHFGDASMKSNYSDKARKNFKARHNCDEANDKLSARYWACKKLWSKNSPKITKPRGE